MRSQRRYTLEEVADIARRHGQDGIAYYPPSNWNGAYVPYGHAYDLEYVRGMATSYRGDKSPRCPECGYNLADAAEHGDHARCAGKIPPIATNDWAAIIKAESVVSDILPNSERT